MSVLDKIAAKIMPPESDEDRREAREKARVLSKNHPWLAEVLSHHEMIEQAFAHAKSTTGPDEALSATKVLGALLASHSIAEEVVLYPALVMNDHKANAMMAYEEQQMAKVETAMLEKLPPLSQEWREKLEHIEGAVAHHIYEEESIWYPKLAEEASSDDQMQITRRFAEEWDRCTIPAG